MKTQDNQENKGQSRRNFIKQSGAVGAGMMLMGSVPLFANSKTSPGLKR